MNGLQETAEKAPALDRRVDARGRRQALRCQPGALASILIVALNIGMRRGEILGLNWANVGLLRRQIMITGTKSGNNRIVPINLDLLSILEDLKRTNGGCGYVFANPKSGRPIHDIKRVFHTACAAAGVRGFRFHDCRHTFGTRLVHRELDRIIVKGLLGHSTVKVTSGTCIRHRIQNARRLKCSR